MGMKSMNSLGNENKKIYGGMETDCFVLLVTMDYQVTPLSNQPGCGLLLFHVSQRLRGNALHFS